MPMRTLDNSGGFGGSVACSPRMAEGTSSFGVREMCVGMHVAWMEGLPDGASLEQTRRVFWMMAPMSSARRGMGARGTSPSG